ncbi:MAG: hypothetical protein M1376_00195 [Planctomycetes bacterium]|nr:hypothetical protein [Planctomycetota bacterium]
MQAPLRKFVVGLIALAVLLGVYWLYARANRTPPIAVEITKALPVPVADVNVSSPQGVGTVLGVDIGKVEQTRFLHRNENNQVDRVFGFEQLLHKQSKQWEITNPYMKLFFPTFRCEVTANRGKVQVEAIFSQLMAEDAQFSGNVVIHILPTEPNDALECFIHLDDVGFQAAQSLFSSTGAVRFLSRQAQLTGTGMELIYDGGRSRLELFQIFQLDSLRLSSRELGSVADLTPRQRPPAAGPAPGASARPTPAGTGPDPSPADRYQCIFHSNVAIATPERVVTARDELAIDQIPGSGSKKPKASVQRAADRSEPNAVPSPGAEALVPTASSHSVISAIPPEAFDTVVTCDGGLEVTPMDTKLKPEARRQKAQGRAALRPPSPVFQNPPAGTPDRQRAAARRIHFDAFTTDTALEGPVEIAFPLDPNGLKGAKTAAQALPMTITAQKAVRFLAATNQVLFEGGCQVVLLRSEPNLTYEYLLTAPQLTLDIATDPNRPKGDNVTARKIVTEGGPAALRILRKSRDKLVGGTTLEAAQLQYEAGPKVTALGPGEIWMRNDELVNPKADPNQFSFGRPCIARLTNFDKLIYSGATNRIVAEDKAQQLLLDYFPLTNGRYDRHTRAIAGHVEALLREVTKGHLELASLTATQGIEYEYEDPTSGQSFIGSSLSYDYAQSLVAVRGDAEQPCYLNGALVDQIDLDLRTGRAQAEILAPSTFQVRR